MTKQITHCTAPLEEVIEFYINQNNTLAETSKHFACKPDAMAGYLKRNGIFKEGAKKTYLKASKEEVYNYYIVQNHSEKETASYFKCGITALENFLKSNNIKKSRSAVNEIESKVKSTLRKEAIYKLVSNIDKEDFINCFNSSLFSKEDILKRFDITLRQYDDLRKYFNLSSPALPIRKDALNLFNNYSKDFIYNFYIVENHTIPECMEHFKVKRDVFLNYLNHYGINKVTHIEDLINNIDKEDFKLSLKSNYSLAQILNKFNINYWQLESLIRFFDIPKIDILIKKGSIPENEFKQLLKENSIEFEPQFSLGNYRYDFKLDSTLIEIDPFYTHNSSLGYRGLVDPLPKDYHYNKTKLALSNGYRCIHVWDWDNKEKIINLLLPRPTIYARKCDIKEVSLQDTKSYINKYHLQGYARDKIRLGLYYQGELVSIMTFGKPRYNKRYEYELIRYCSHYNVLGGAEKLFKHFINNYNPSSIISYCDNSKFKGKVYKDLGFNFKSFGKPTKHWYNENLHIHITDNLLRQRGFDQLLGDKLGFYGKDTSNEDLMLKHGFVEIYDCGQSTYEWVNPLIPYPNKKLF